MKQLKIKYTYDDPYGPDQNFPSERNEYIIKQINLDEFLVLDDEGFEFILNLNTLPYENFSYELLEILEPAFKNKMLGKVLKSYTEMRERMIRLENLVEILRN